MTVTYFAESGTSFRSSARILPATMTAIEVERGSFLDKTFLHKNYWYTYDFILASVSFAVDIYSQDCKRKC
jgi:hypothetical protein